MALKDILPGDRKKNKTIPVSHSKDHPDVQKIADKKLEKMRKKMFGGVGMIGDSFKKTRKMQAKAEKEAKDSVALEIGEARADAAKLIERTNKELEAQKSTALAQLETQVDELSQLIKEKLLGKEVVL